MRVDKAAVGLISRSYSFLYKNHIIKHRMHMSTKSKFKIGIVGLPCSGSTLLVKIMNSAENAACFFEPYSSTEGKEFYHEKLGNMKFNSIADIRNNLGHAAKKCDVVGFKEIFNHTKEIYNEEMLDYLDIIIFIFREPKVQYSRIVARKKQVNLDEFINKYKSMVNFYLDWKMQGHNTVALNYEDLCREKMDYLNQKLSPHILFSGKLDMKPLFSQTGDLRGKYFPRIRKPKISYDLSNQQLDKVFQLSSLFVEVITAK